MVIPIKHEGLKKHMNEIKELVNNKMIDSEGEFLKNKFEMEDKDIETVITHIKYD